MEFNRLGHNNTKKVLLVLVVLVAITTTIVSLSSRAKYQVTSSVQIVKGKVSYQPYDFKIVKIYQENDTGNYDEVDEVPTTGYEINEEDSKCMIDDNTKDTGAILKTINGNHTFANLKKMDKCTLYFSKKKTLSEKTLDNLRLKKAGNLSTTIDKYACDDNTNNSGHTSGNCTSTDKGVYETTDDYGKSYVFRGTVDNNWVHFANMYWRIIRINGNGTIRLIYAGTTKPSEGKWGNTGDNAAIKTSTGATKSAFNDYYNDNKYVGYMFGTAESGSVSSESNPTTSYAQAHENNYDSTIKEEIDKWYEGNSGIQTQFRDKIDVETGFCSDRQLSPENHGSYLGAKESKAGYDKTQTAYAGYHRTHDAGTNYDSTQEPTLKCGYDVTKGTTDKDAQERDLFTGPSAQGTTDSEGNEIKGNNKLTTPVGLITMDEVIMAGGLGGQQNYGYWLYTGQYYWNMSPYIYGTNARMFRVDTGGGLGSTNMSSVNSAYGVRPVINLKADTTFTGDGTKDTPYEVS